MKLLIPIFDFEQSERAVGQAIEIAKDYHFTIILAAIVDSKILIEYARNERLWHQVDGSLIYNSGMMNEHREIYNRLTMSAARHMEEVVEKYHLSEQGIEKKILVGEPFEKILELAEHEKIDLIIMGKSKEKMIFRPIRKSVVDRVVDKAKCPVLLLDAIAG